MPTIRPWEKYREWCREYRSDVVFVHLPMQPTLILGSATAAFDLLDKRSNIYSDRIVSHMLDLMGWGFDFVFMRYSQRWRTHRRMFRQQFHQDVVAKYRPVQLQQARVCLLSILTSPQYTRKHARLYVTSTIFYVTYGKKITSMDDEYVRIAQIALEGGSIASIVGAFWIEYLPILRHIPTWVPGTVSMKTIAKYRPYLMDMVNKPFEEVKIALSSGTATPSVATTLLEQVRSDHEGTAEEAYYEEVAKNVTGIAYGGTQLTTSACESFLLAMVLFPDIQKKAQAELARVVARTRLPEFDDIDDVPYIRALVMETMRWMPVTPFGVPHATISEDEYHGYHIPKGTMILPNIWAMLHDPQDYRDPDQFKPERFIGKDGKMDSSVRDPTTISFGFGRRICPGRHFSQNTLSIFIASVLHVFDITPGVDASGKLVVLTDEMEGGLIAMPRTVPCGLKPRSEQAAHLVREAAADGAVLDSLLAPLVVTSSPADCGT
ncbi:hypothetical protein EIP91_004048 [Steccherinum ochraceum]|uniref:Cytochrome P450 n=1 Tax=Steccherinum ochraceum TaxID=92696 RepID=A0A4V2MW09_9APHY|nr:hypothetical protein EIP91_004048 [Steccherinum ochraceum]